MGEDQPLPEPVDQTQATRLILGFCTKPISQKRADELRNEYGCYFYYASDLSDIKALETVYAEDQHLVKERYDEAAKGSAEPSTFMHIDQSNAVAVLTQFKFKRVLKHNLVLVYAHVAACNTTRGVPWAANQEGIWVPRYLYNERRYSYRTLVQLINIDWKRA